MTQGKFPLTFWFGETNKPTLLRLDVFLRMLLFLFSSVHVPGESKSPSVKVAGDHQDTVNRSCLLTVFATPEISRIRFRKAACIAIFVAPKIAQIS